MSGKKTSIWLPDDLVRRWQESGASLAYLVRVGLDNQHDSLADRVTEMAGVLDTVVERLNDLERLRVVVDVVQLWKSAQQDAANIRAEAEAEAEEIRASHRPIKRAEPPKLFGPEVMSRGRFS